jgi:hypothetical protein
LKVVATSMMKAANRTSIAKTQTVKLLLREDRTVQEEAIAHMAEEEAVVAGIAEVAPVVAPEAIVVLVAAVEIAAGIASLSSFKVKEVRHGLHLFSCEGICLWSEQCTSSSPSLLFRI